MAAPLLASKITRANARLDIKLESEELAAMRSIYERARLEIAGRLAEARAESFTAQHYRSALAQVNSGLREMRKAISTHYNRTADRALDESVNRLLREIDFWERERGFGLGPLGRIQTDALRRINSGTLIKRFETSMKTYGSALEGEIQRRLSVSIAKRAPWHEMATDISGRLERHAITGARHRAERIVRTELHYALGQGRHAALVQAAEELPRLRRQWDATIEARTCTMCRALNGEIVDLDKAFSDGSMGTPRHPNCRCSIVPWRAEWAELEAGGEAHTGG
jgi:SPP1 gp7 family putative phage head morphogenesis protein